MADHINKPQPVKPKVACDLPSNIGGYKYGSTIHSITTLVGNIIMIR